MPSLLPEDLFLDIQASLTRTAAPKALFDALDLFVATPNAALGDLASDLAMDESQRNPSGFHYASPGRADRLHWLLLAAGSSQERANSAWGVFGAFTAARLPVIGASPQHLATLQTALQAAAQASPGTARGHLHLRSLTLHNGSPSELDFQAAPSESGGGALPALLLWRLLVALSRPADRVTRRTAASMAEFLAGRAADAPEADVLRNVATKLRSESDAAVDVGYLAPIVEHFARSNWTSAASTAQLLASNASEASLAIAWSVVGALCLVRARRVGVDLSHAAQILLARCSAFRPSPSAVQAWAADLLAASYASQGRLRELAETVSSGTIGSPIDFLGHLPADLQGSDLSSWMLGSALLLDAAESAPSTQTWLPWAHTLAEFVRLPLPASAPAPAGDEWLLANALVQAHQQPGGNTLQPLENLAQRYEPARELLHRLRARMRRQDSPATRSLVAALRARQWNDARSLLQSAEDLVFSSAVRDALLQLPDADVVEIVRLLPNLHSAFGNHAYIAVILEELSERTLPAPDAFGTLLLLQHGSMSEEVRGAWSDACVNFGRQTPPDRLRTLALATCLNDPTRLTIVARSLALHPEPRPALHALSSLADRAQGDAQAGVLRAWSGVLSDGPERVQVAERLLAVDARDAAALQIVLDWAVAQSSWEDVVRIRERIGRSTSDSSKRAVIYLEIAEVLEKRLDNANGALENAIVSFICDPARAETLVVLERLYRAQKKYRDLLATYDTVIEVSLASGDTDRASDLWARRAQVSFQALQRPEEAARSLLEAIRLRPGSQKLVDLMVKSVAPAAGGTWAEQAQALHRASQP